MNNEQFQSDIKSGYTFSGDSLLLGAAVYDKAVVKGLQVRMPLSTINRHGLISGATGTGKTKTIQQFTECLSAKGISVLAMDIKGDLSGIAKPGTDNPKITERHASIGSPWQPVQLPVELLTISEENGVRMRATVSEFGPVLLSKILELNENQQGAVTVVFKYCDDKKLPLLDIKDFRQVLQFVTGEGKEELVAYGQISQSTVGVIMRKLLEVEQQGADKFFGEVSFDVEDLLRKDQRGFGTVNILRLTDIQDRPKMFSTFMLCLLAEIYNKFPEMGDKAAPKLVIFIDEAHLIFREATSALMDQLETVVKLIRSRGVGLYFCTQVPGDIPDIILSQLGAKFQHALRAFTAKDRKDIRLVAENYPETKYYDTEKLLTELGIGEALVTVLNEKGAPTPLAHTLLCAPGTRMDVLSTEEINQLAAASTIAEKYNKVVDRDSAYEMLTGKIGKDENQPKDVPANDKNKTEESSGVIDTLSAITRNPLVKSVVRDLARGLFGTLLKGRR